MGKEWRTGKGGRVRIMRSKCSVPHFQNVCGTRVNHFSSFYDMLSYDHCRMGTKMKRSFRLLWQVLFAQYSQMQEFPTHSAGLYGCLAKSCSISLLPHTPHLNAKPMISQQQVGDHAREKAVRASPYFLFIVPAHFMPLRP